MSGHEMAKNDEQQQPIETLSNGVDMISDGNRKNNFLSLKHKAEILKRLDEGAMASKLAREYGISKSTISRFKQRKETIHKAVTTIYPNNTNRRTMRGSLYQKTEAALYKWYLEQQKRNINVTGHMIREKAQLLYNECEDSNYSFGASAGWLKNFKRRFGIQLPNNNGSCEKREAVCISKLEVDPLHADNPITNSCNVQKETQNVDKKEALRCIDTVIRWSNENTVDSLYITMLQSLKNQMKIGTKIKYVCK